MVISKPTVAVCVCFRAFVFFSPVITAIRHPCVIYNSVLFFFIFPSATSLASPEVRSREQKDSTLSSSKRKKTGAHTWCLPEEAIRNYPDWLPAKTILYGDGDVITSESAIHMILSTFCVKVLFFVRITPLCRKFSAVKEGFDLNVHLDEIILVRFLHVEV